MQYPIMIFAAGFGTRMKHLTKDRPKPMIEVAGQPLIDHAVNLAREASASKIVVNLHYKAEVLERHFQNTDVRTILEAPDILDTGGGLRNAMPLLETDPVITLNCDAVWKGPNPLKQLAKAWDPDKMDALLMCIPINRTIGYDRPGSFLLDQQGKVRRGNGLVYCGAQIMKTDRLSHITESAFSLNRVWDTMIERNSLYAMEYDGFWCDVGHPEGVGQAEDLIAGDHV